MFENHCIILYEHTNRYIFVLKLCSKLCCAKTQYIAYSFIKIIIHFILINTFCRDTKTITQQTSSERRLSESTVEHRYVLKLYTYIHRQLDIIFTLYMLIFYISSIKNNQQCSFQICDIHLDVLQFNEINKQRLWKIV